MSSKSLSAYKQFTTVTYSDIELLKKHSLDETGVWQIFGEDPNCDWGGHHSEPDLGFVNGSLREVIKYAVKLPNFWTWGGGGRIVKIVPQNIKDLEEVNQLIDRKFQLEQELENVNKALGVRS